jgi:hypothetical protein
MWTAIVGYSGAGKTPGLNVSRNALASVERSREDSVDEMRRQHETRAAKAKAALKNWKEEIAKAHDLRSVKQKPPEADGPGPFVAPRFYTNDATIEKLAILISVRHRGILVVRDELSGLFANMCRYAHGGSDRPFWLEAWNGGPYSVERIGRLPLTIPHLLVGLTGGFQPDKLVNAFKGDDDGFYARILFGWPVEPNYAPLTDDVKEVDPELEEVFLRLINLRDHDEPRSVPLSAAARERFEQLRRSHFDGRAVLDGREREQWAKAQTHVLRLAGTLAYLDWAMPTTSSSLGVNGFGALLKSAQEPSEIDVRFMEAAIWMWLNYFWPHGQAAVRLMGISDRHKNARRVLNWLQATGKTSLSREDVRVHALSRSLDAGQVDNLLGELTRAGWLREKPSEKSGRPGRPARRWDVNPAVRASHVGTGNSANAENPRPTQ